MRGVSLDADGVFFAPLWTNFRVGDETGILDWYTVLVAVTAAVALVHHGALWLVGRTGAPVSTRAARAAARAWPAVVVLAIATTVASFTVQPRIAESIGARPWGLVFPLVAAAGLVASRLLSARGRPAGAFRASSAFLYGLVGAVAVGLYPLMLPARDPALGLAVGDVTSTRHGLVIALFWWIPGMLLVAGYTWFVYRRILR